MSIETYVQIISLGVYGLATLILLCVNFFQAKKAKDAAKEKEILSKTQEEISNTALELIQQAEAFKNYTGEEKLNWVLTRLKQLNQSLYNETELTALINKLVEMSKNVNSKGV